MGYISAQEVKEKRNEIKKAFPKTKFSVTCKNSSTINIAILESDLDFAPALEGRDYTSVNHFYIESNFKNQPELQAMLLKINEIAKDGQRIISEDLDYGQWPNYYIQITIGKWDRPFKFKA